MFTLPSESSSAALILRIEPDVGGFDLTGDSVG